MNNQGQGNTPFILGIIAIVCMVASWLGTPGVGIIAVVLGIIAWVMGNNALRTIPDDVQARNGRTMGMIVTILAIVSLVITMLLVGGLISTGLLFALA